MPHTALALVEHNGQLLAVRNTSSGSTDTRWTFPSVDVADGQTSRQVLEQALQTAFGLVVHFGDLFVALNDPERTPPRIEVCLLRVEGEPPPAKTFHWVSTTELCALDAMPIARDVIDRVQESLITREIGKLLSQVSPTARNRIWPRASAIAARIDQPQKVSISGGG